MSAETPVYSSTPSILGPNPLWNKPGFKLPDYVENVARGIATSNGGSLQQAIPEAIATIKRWAAGGGKVHPEVRAAAGKALAEWESLRASAHADHTGKSIGMTTTTSFWAPLDLTKTETRDDGTIVVFGKATDDALDRDQQRCDSEWLNKAMPEWYRTGANIREQHDPKKAAGRALEHQIGADGGHYIRAHIVDPVSVLKVNTGVLQGFSIGVSDPHISKSGDAPRGRIDGGDVSEVSLCDRPSNPGCMLQLAKAATPDWEGNAADYDEARGLVKCEELVIDKTDTPELTKAAEAAEPDAAKADAPTIKPDEPVQTGAVRDAGSPANQTADPDFKELANAAAMNGGAGCGCCDNCICNDKLTGEKAAVSAGFDRDAALALVEKVNAGDFLIPALLKADDGADDDESSDIAGAKQAIGIIGQLVASEAAGLADNPAWEACDIQLLLDALSSLRCFVNREEMEAAGVGGDGGALMLADTPDLTKADKYSADELKAMAKKGHAMNGPDGPDYPIGDEDDLNNAIRAVGRGKGDHDAIRKHIIAGAKRLGLSKSIPDNWNADGSLAASKADTPDLTKADEGTQTTKAAAVDAPAADPQELAKALGAELTKADSPLREQFEGIVKAAVEGTVKSVSELTERLARIEQMPVPGGPALRRPEVAQKAARISELEAERQKLAILAAETDDAVLRKGYRQNIADLTEAINKVSA